VDDIHIPSCTTVGAMIVPATLLAAVAAQADDRDLLCGLVAGYEAMTQLGCAMDGALRIYQGVWSTYLATPFSVAAGLARLGRFDAEQMAHAMAIAASRSSGITGRTVGPNGSRWFVAGSAGADGYWAAQAAGMGLIGDLAILETGFPKATGVALKPLQGGADWGILAIDTKPFRTSRQALSATEAYLRASEGRPAEDVVAVQAWVPAQVRAMVDNPSFGLGVQRQIALAACDREALWDVAQLRKQDEQALEAFAGRVMVADDAKLTALYPRQWGARVEVRFSDGASSTVEVLDPPGSARALYSWDALLRKHQSIARASDLPADWIEPGLDLCRHFGGTASTSHAEALVRLLPGLG
jgi:2-methylcitrate dehydratase PrpD